MNTNRRRSKSMFWGTLFIVLGILMIVQAILPFDLPIGKILLACFLIYLGLNMLMPGKIKIELGKAFRDKDTLVFASGTLKPDSPDSTHEEFSVIFSRGQIDLTGLTLNKGAANIVVNSVFGDSTVEVDANHPVAIESSAVFGSVHTPSHSSMKNTGEKTLRLKLQAVFGSISVVPREKPQAK